MEMSPNEGMQESVTRRFKDLESALRACLFAESSRSSRGAIDQVLGIWSKMEALALELEVENSYMKGRIRELESSGRKTYAGVVGSDGKMQDGKEVPKRKETYSVMVKSKDSRENGDRILEKVNKMEVDVRVENVRKNRTGGLIIETRSKEEVEKIKQAVKANPDWLWRSRERSMLWECLLILRVHSII